MKEVGFENYKALVRKVDGFLKLTEQAFVEDLVCRKGCHECCRHLTLFPVEAFHIRLALDGLESELKKKIHESALSRIDDPEGPCPLLESGICLLYQERPLICRTHGFPVLMRTEEGVTVDYCPLNFTSGRKPDRTHILDIEALNAALVAINRLFIKNGFGDTPLPVPGRILLAQALSPDFEIAPR